MPLPPRRPQARKLQPPPQELLREVMELRLEVYRQGAELADWKIRQLDYSLAQAQFQLRALDDEERTIMQDRTGPDTPDGEVGARRAEMSADELPRLREQQRTVQQHVKDMTALAMKERVRRTRLDELTKQVEARLKEVGP